MAPDERFPRVVSLACHDLRTPLATVYGFARTLSRAGELDDRTRRFVGMIEEAAEQMTVLLDRLGTAARIQAERWEPVLREVDTLDLARSGDDRIESRGNGTTVTTEADVVASALESLAVAASRFGPVDTVAWDVDGRVLELSPITDEAAPVIMAEDLRDLGAIVARYEIEQLGGALELAGDRLRVTL
jgi:signal transduction histidine kinase